MVPIPGLRFLFQPNTLYVCIYIYGCGAICRRKVCHFYRSFSNFIAKNGQKEMLLICPVSVCSRSIEITQNWLETAVPSPFFKKVIGTAVSGLYIGSFWVDMLTLLVFLAPQKALNCRHVEHVELYLSKKAKNCCGKWPHKHIYIYIYVVEFLSGPSLGF